MKTSIKIDNTSFNVEGVSQMSKTDFKKTFKGVLRSDLDAAYAKIQDQAKANKAEAAKAAKADKGSSGEK